MIGIYAHDLPYWYPVEILKKMKLVMIMITTSVKIVVSEGILSSFTPTVSELPLKTIVIYNV